MLDALGGSRRLATRSTNQTVATPFEARSPLSTKRRGRLVVLDLGNPSPSSLPLPCGLWSISTIYSPESAGIISNLACGLGSERWQNFFDSDGPLRPFGRLLHLHHRRLARRVP